MLRAQLLKTRVDHGELVEVAVAGRARELQLLDRRRQAALQRIGLALRVVLQQALAERGVGLGLHAVELGVAWIARQRIAQRAERGIVLTGLLERGDVGIAERARVRVVLARLGEERGRAAKVARGEPYARGQHVDHRARAAEGV